MKIVKIIGTILSIVCIPILLNYLLRIPITTVIGGFNSDVVWLNFWANYGGAILGGFISLYILRATITHNKQENKEERNYNHNRFLYEQQKIDLDKETERLNLFLQLFDQNKLKFIYNVRLEEKGRSNESLHMLGNFYSLAFERFHQFSIYYTNEEFSSNPFLIQQEENYVSLMHLLDDLQILLSVNPENWSHKELQEQNINRAVKYKNIPIHRLMNILNKSIITKGEIIDDLLVEYKEIGILKVQSQIREYINKRRQIIDGNFINKYNG